jgi:hypothetical protein
MSKILRYKDHVKLNKMVNTFMDSLHINLNESSIELNQKTVDKILKGVIKDMRINNGLFDKFKTNITESIPVVKALIENSNIKFETSPENLVLVTLTILGISSLEEMDNKAGHGVLPCTECGGSGCKSCDDGVIKSILDKREAQSLLEELRMRGIGNGIVKKMVQSFVSIGEFTTTMLKGTEYSVNGLMDMLDKEHVMKPIMNALQQFITNYDITIETLSNNLLSLGSTIKSQVSKRGIKWLINKLKDAFGIEDIKMPDIDDTDILNSDTTDDQVIGNNLIKEQ